eukprot:g2623.t1
MLAAFFSKEAEDKVTESLEKEGVAAGEVEREVPVLEDNEDSSLSNTIGDVAPNDMKERIGSVNRNQKFDSFSLFDQVCCNMTAEEKAYETPGGVKFDVVLLPEDTAEIDDAEEEEEEEEEASRERNVRLLNYEHTNRKDERTERKMAEEVASENVGNVRENLVPSLAERYEAVRLQLRRRMLEKQGKERAKRNVRGAMGRENNETVDRPRNGGGEGKGGERRPPGLRRGGRGGYAGNRSHSRKHGLRTTTACAPLLGRTRGRTSSKGVPLYVPPPPPSYAYLSHRSKPKRGPNGYQWLGPPRRTATRSCVIGLVDGIGLTYKRMSSRGRAKNKQNHANDDHHHEIPSKRDARARKRFSGQRRSNAAAVRDTRSLLRGAAFATSTPPRGDLGVRSTTTDRRNAQLLKHDKKNLKKNRHASKAASALSGWFEPKQRQRRRRRKKKKLAGDKTRNVFLGRTSGGVGGEGANDRQHRSIHSPQRRRRVYPSAAGAYVPEVARHHGVVVDEDFDNTRAHHVQQHLLQQQQQRWRGLPHADLPVPRAMYRGEFFADSDAANALRHGRHDAYRETPGIVNSLPPPSGNYVRQFSRTSSQDESGAFAMEGRVDNEYPPPSTAYDAAVVRQRQQQDHLRHFAAAAAAAAAAGDADATTGTAALASGPRRASVESRLVAAVERLREEQETAAVVEHFRRSSNGGEYGGGRREGGSGGGDAPQKSRPRGVSKHSNSDNLSEEFAGPVFDDDEEDEDGGNVESSASMRPVVPSLSHFGPSHGSGNNARNATAAATAAAPTGKRRNDVAHDDDAVNDSGWEAPTRSERGIDIPPLRLIAANIQTGGGDGDATNATNKGSSSKNNVNAADRLRHRSSSSEVDGAARGVKLSHGGRSSSSDAATSGGGEARRGESGATTSNVGRSDARATNNAGGSGEAGKPGVGITTTSSGMLSSHQHQQDAGEVRDRPTMQIAAANKTRARNICRRLLMLAAQPEQGDSPVRTPFGAELWDLPAGHPAFIAAAELLKLQSFVRRRHYYLRRALKIVHPEAVRHQLMHEHDEDESVVGGGFNLGHRLLFYGDRLGALTTAVREGFHAVSPSGLLVFSTDVAIADRIREQLRTSQRRRRPSGESRSNRSIWRVLLAAVNTGRSFRSPVALSDFASESNDMHSALQDFVAEGWQTLEFEGPGLQEKTFLCQQSVKQGLMGNEPFIPCYLLEYISE